MSELLLDRIENLLSVKAPNLPKILFNPLCKADFEHRMYFCICNHCDANVSRARDIQAAIANQMGVAMPDPSSKPVLSSSGSKVLNAGNKQRLKIRTGGRGSGFRIDLLAMWDRRS